MSESAAQHDKPSSPQEDASDKTSSQSAGETSSAQQNMKETSSKMKNRQQQPRIPWQTRVRTKVVPYLPPPVVHALQDVIDPALAPYMGPEASVTLISTLIVAYLTTRLFRFVWLRSTSSSGRAIAAADDDQDRLLSAQQAAGDDFDGTVLLCGPLGSGKTRLFYQFVYNQPQVDTVTSLSANVGLATVPSATSASKKTDPPVTTTIRYVDWPGHASLQDEALQEAVWNAKRPLRIVFVLDSTQPVAPAARTLFELLNLLHEQQQSNNNSKRNKPVLFVACHKKDLSKSKKWQRCKIQLRTELERMISVEQTKAANAAPDDSNNNGQQRPWWSRTQQPEGSSSQLDLDDLPMATLRFSSTTAYDEATGGVTEDLLEFCQTGQ